MKKRPAGRFFDGREAYSSTAIAVWLKPPST